MAWIGLVWTWSGLGLDLERLQVQVLLTVLEKKLYSRHSCCGPAHVEKDPAGRSCGPAAAAFAPGPDGLGHSETSGGRNSSSSDGDQTKIWV